MKTTHHRLSSSFPKLCERLSSFKNGDDNIRELQAVFAYMDANRDGRISVEELKKSFNTLGEQLSDEEAKVVEEEKKRKMLGALRMYIDEGEDCITPRSLKTMLMKLGELRTNDDCRVMIKAFDLNDDGVLNFDGFAHMMMR
ncbi:hypothetical protein F2Q70_00016252 [Brassica cretica]|uniref:EF-hand domain-containing protein n=2 Tax=Brassica TaxID=3705 RepID=A0A3N6Q8F3_BRACR|nr:hypothetical protein F2Q70_00016252 [Brassica cretica]KAF2600702.1 hypothetical protein F2Q68_00009234 [Brassica cretica]